MKETVKEIFEDLKDRSTNPFITSFILSWLIYNWIIVVGLVFYSQEQLAKSNYKSFIGLIQMESSNEKMIFWPLFWAAVYTFILSAGKQLVIGYQDYLISRRKNIVFTRTKNHQSITVAYFEKVKTQLEEDAVKFAKLVQEESKISLENDTLRKKEAEYESVKLQIQTDHLNNLNTVKNSHNIVVQNLQAKHQETLQETANNANEIERALHMQNEELTKTIKLLRQQVADLAPGSSYKRHVLELKFSDAAQLFTNQDRIKKLLEEQFLNFGIQGYSNTYTPGQETLIYNLDFKHLLTNDSKNLILDRMSNALLGYSFSIRID